MLWGLRANVMLQWSGLCSATFTFFILASPLCSWVTNWVFILIVYFFICASAASPFLFAYGCVICCATLLFLVCLFSALLMLNFSISFWLLLSDSDTTNHGADLPHWPSIKHFSSARLYFESPCSQKPCQHYSEGEICHVSVQELQSFQSLWC